MPLPEFALEVPSALALGCVAIQKSGTHSVGRLVSTYAIDSVLDSAEFVGCRSNRVNDRPDNYAIRFARLTLPILKPRVYRRHATEQSNRRLENDEKREAAVT